MLPGFRMALAAFVATTLLIGVGFAAIGLLVSARQDGNFALAPAKDPWRTALRPPMDEPAVTLMTTVVESEPPAAGDIAASAAQPAPVQTSLDVGPVVIDPPAASLESAAVDPMPRPAGPVDAQPAASESTVAPSDVIARLAPAAEPAPPPAPLAEPIAEPAEVAASVPEADVGPVQSAPPVSVLATLEAPADATASVLAPAAPVTPTPHAAVAAVPKQAASRPAKAASPPARTAVKPSAKTAPKKAVKRKVPPRAKARVVPRAPARPASPGTTQSRGPLEAIFGPSASH